MDQHLSDILPPPSLPQFEPLLYTNYYQQYPFVQYVPDSPIPPQHVLEVVSPTFPQRLVIKCTTKDTVAQIVTVPPHLCELIYLKALLLRISGKDFNDLRTVNEVLYPTFQEAAKVLGLFENDEEAEHILQEAVD